MYGTTTAANFWLPGAHELFVFALLHGIQIPARSFDQAGEVCTQQSLVQGDETEFGAECRGPTGNGFIEAGRAAALADVGRELDVDGMVYYAAPSRSERSGITFTFPSQPTSKVIVSAQLLHNQKCSTVTISLAVPDGPDIVLRLGTWKSTPSPR